MRYRVLIGTTNKTREFRYDSEKDARWGSERAVEVGEVERRAGDDLHLRAQGGKTVGAGTDGEGVSRGVGVNVGKMRRQLERNEASYQWQHLAQHPRAPQFPALQRLVESMRTVATQPVRINVPALGVRWGRPGVAAGEHGPGAAGGHGRAADA